MAGEPLNKSLAKEIDTLLAGKSLVEPKNKAGDAPKKDERNERGFLRPEK